MEKHELDILGTGYTFQFVESHSKELDHGAGIYKHRTKEIFIDGEHVKNDKIDGERVILHELLHAYLAESGLMKYSEDELLVDWIASQWDKIAWTYAQAKGFKMYLSEEEITKERNFKMSKYENEADKGDIGMNEIEKIHMDKTIDDSLSILYKQIIKLYLISLGFEFDESINMKSLSYLKKFVMWKVDNFNFNEITDKIITTLQSVKKFVENENIVPKDYKFNVRDVEPLRDKDNYEVSLFRTIIQFQ